MEPFEHVVARHGPTVLRVCRAVVGPADAEDAWSETFLSALRAYPELDEGADVRAWLVTIAHRRAIDVWRARSRRAVPVGDLPDRPSDGDDDPHRWDGRLWSALRALPDKQRAAVAYHHVAGLPYADVAAVIGGTEAAARRAAADGVAALRRVGGLEARQGVRT
jgi:RNA polymerase sigma factor (sigma-70 family)